MDPSAHSSDPQYRAALIRGMAPHVLDIQTIPRLEDALRLLADRIRVLLSFDCAAARFVSSIGQPDILDATSPALSGEEVVLDEELWLRLVREKQPATSPGILAVPVLGPRNEVLGALWGLRRETGIFAPEERERLQEFAHQVAPTFELHRSRQQLARQAEIAPSILQLVFDTMPMGIFWKDRESRYLGCNRVVAQAFGLASPAEITGRTDYELPGLTREQADFFITKDRQVMQTNSPALGIIEQASLADGRTIWMETNKVPLHDAAGQVIGILGTWQNVTERQKALEALRRSEANLAAAQRVGQIGSWELDFVRQRATWSEEGFRLLGLDAGSVEPSQEQFMTCVHPDDRDRVRETTQRAIEERTLLSHEFRVIWPDGQVRWLHSRGSVILNARGEPTGFLGISLDITQRKEAEEALREKEERLRLATETADIGYFDWNLRTNQIYFSPRWKSQLGHESHELLNSWDAFESRLHPEDRERTLAALRAFLTDTGLGNFVEFRLRHKNGSYRWIHTRMGLIRDGGGEPVRMLGTHLDITERRSAEEERRRLESQMQHAQKLESLGVLAGGIAHDFNNLLTCILGYADLALLELPASSSARPLIEDAMNGARRAAELTQQMLAYSGKGRFVVQPLNLSSLTEEMSRLLQISISKKCVLKYELHPALPAVEADAVQMRQVVMNLVINASEAIGEQAGIISISTGVMHCDRAYLNETYLNEELPEGEYVYLEVADNGCGMVEETRARIFDPFFTTKFTGRGLGLSAVLGIVRGHRGAIKCYSEFGRGTTFKVLFPRFGGVAQLVEPSIKGEAGWKSTGLVLVVDDEEAIRGIARQMLRKMGFTVLTACDGLQALDVFRLHRDAIRLILLDMTMPNLDGEETYRELRRLDPGVRVVLSSGYNEQTATSRFVGKGLAGFVQKPYQFEDLQVIVRRVLDQAAGKE